MKKIVFSPLLASLLVLLLLIFAFKQDFKKAFQNLDKDPVKTITKTSISPTKSDNVNGPVVGNSTGKRLDIDLRKLPTSSPQKINVYRSDPKDIQVSSSKLLYSLNENVEITVKNNSNQEFSYIWGPSCGLGFEKKVEGSWIRTEELCFNCQSAAPCSTENLKAGESLKTKIKPEENSSGTFRALFTFMGGNSYSNEFQLLTID